MSDKFEFIDKTPQQHREDRDAKRAEGKNPYDTASDVSPQFRYRLDLHAAGMRRNALEHLDLTQQRIECYTMERGFPSLAEQIVALTGMAEAIKVPRLDAARQAAAHAGEAVEEGIGQLRSGSDETPFLAPAQEVASTLREPLASGYAGDLSDEFERTRQEIIELGGQMGQLLASWMPEFEGLRDELAEAERAIKGGMPRTDS